MIAVGAISVLIWAGIFLYRLLNGKGIAYLWYLFILVLIFSLVYSDPNVETAFLGILWVLICLGSLIALPFFHKSMFALLDRPFSYEKEQLKKKEKEQKQGNDIIANSKNHSASQRVEKKLEAEKKRKEQKIEQDKKDFDQFYSDYSHLINAYLSKFEELAPSMPYIFVDEFSGREIGAKLYFIDTWFTNKVFGEKHFFTAFLKLEIFSSQYDNEVYINFYAFDDELSEKKLKLNKDITSSELESIFEENWEKLLYYIKSKKIEDEFLTTYTEMKKIADKEGVSLVKISRNLKRGKK